MIKNNNSFFGNLICFARKPFVSHLNKPGFLVLGAQKAGTTSLYRYLTSHPYIEPSYFPGELHYFDLNFHKGDKWYATNFRSLKPKIITGEKSPYYLYHPLVPQRAHAYDSNLKIIVLLRNLVKRAYSHYIKELRNKNEHRTFREACVEGEAVVEIEHERLANEEVAYSFAHQRWSYLARGKYIEQLDRWCRYFPREQIYIDTAERFFNSPVEVCNDIFQFLGQELYLINSNKKHNQRQYESMRSEDHAWLMEYYRQYNQKLSEEYHIDVSGWQ